MRYYQHLYVSEELSDKRERVISRLEERRFQPFLHLVILPDNSGNQLEILNGNLLLQSDYPLSDPLVVGITKGYDEALELVETICREVYDHTGDLNIRDYILAKEQEG
jgi:hypothetical protein